MTFGGLFVVNTVKCADFCLFFVIVLCSFVINSADISLLWSQKHLIGLNYEARWPLISLAALKEALSFWLIAKASKSASLAFSAHSLRSSFALTGEKGEKRGPLPPLRGKKKALVS